MDTAKRIIQSSWHHTNIGFFQPGDTYEFQRASREKNFAKSSRSACQKCFSIGLRVVPIGYFVPPADWLPGPVAVRADYDEGSRSSLSRISLPPDVGRDDEDRRR